VIFLTKLKFKALLETGLLNFASFAEL